jgi:hypothetical protein
MMDCRTRGEYVWRSTATVVRAIGEGMRKAFGFSLVFGELCFLLLPLFIRDIDMPLVPVAAFLIVVLTVLRLRDSYAYPSAGSSEDIVKDAAFGIVLLVVFEVACALWAPRLAFTIGRAFRASVGALLAAQWRAIYHREDPPDEIRRNFLKRKIATWHMNVLFVAVSSPIVLTNAIAVPAAGHLRDLVLGYLPPIFIMLAWRSKKKRWTYLIDRRPISTFEDGVLRDLERQRAILPVSERDSKLPVDVFFEVLYFLSLAYLPLVAAWRWISASPLAGEVDWLQAGVNFTAVIWLAAIWAQIKDFNRTLAADLDEAIRIRKATETGQAS